MEKYNVKIRVQESGTGHYFHYKIVEVLDDNIPQFIKEYLNNWESNTTDWDVRFESGDIQEFEMLLEVENGEIVSCGY